MRKPTMVVSVKLEWLDDGKLAERLTFDNGKTTTTTHSGGDLVAKMDQIVKRHQSYGRPVEILN